MILVIFIVVFWMVHFESSLSLSGVTTNGEIYICLDDDIPCLTTGTSDSDLIDPRIVIPGDLCPAGTYPCYGKDTPCGVRLVEDDVSMADGKSDPGSHPWQAYLKNATHIFSGSGALVDSFHLITAAHKVQQNVAKPEEITVFMGVWNPSDLRNTQSSSVLEIRLHPSFNDKTLLDDIAILRLAQPIVFGIQNNINKICLPVTTSVFIKTKCIVAGWGQSSFTTPDAPTMPQMQVSVEVVDPLTCRDSFVRPGLLGDKVDVYLDQIGEICAGGEPLRDACSQDGGSPLTCPDADGNLNVAGLVIWGKNCGQPGVYGVYVNVPYYVEWIKVIIDELNHRH